MSATGLFVLDILIPPDEEEEDLYDSDDNKRMVKADFDDMFIDEAYENCKEISFYIYSDICPTKEYIVKHIEQDLCEDFEEVVDIINMCDNFPKLTTKIKMKSDGLVTMRRVNANKVKVPKGGYKLEIYDN